MIVVFDENEAMRPWTAIKEKLRLLADPHHYLPQVKVLLWGARRSGKTTVMYRWKLGVFLPTVPTVGTLTEPIIYRPAKDRQPVKLLVSEIGRDPLSLEVVTMDDDKAAEFDETRCCCCRRRRRRPEFGVSTWVRHGRRAGAVVYVVDSSSRTSLLEMFEDLNLILYNDDLVRRDCRVLILANKQDVWGALTPPQIEQMLKLPFDVKKRCCVAGCSALTGDNLEAVLAWVYDGLRPSTTLRLECV